MNYEKITSKRLEELHDLLRGSALVSETLSDVRSRNSSDSEICEALMVQLCSARVYIGELHRQIDDLKGGSNG